MAEDTQTTDSSSLNPFKWSGHTYALFLLRAFMGMRLFMSGKEKICFEKTVFKLDLAGWTAEGGKAEKIGQVMVDYAGMDMKLIKLFMIPLPFMMIATGVCIMLGLLNRLAWWGAGMIWFSLAIGQMMLPDEQTINYLGQYTIMCVLALAWLKHNKLAITKF
jgi:uncharacterized membrane protein YphA (DoxX/SURF4 family)